MAVRSRRGARRERCGLGALLQDRSARADLARRITAAATLTQIDPFPSINDSGMTAPVGTVAAGTTVFTADGTGDPIALGFSPVFSRNYGSGKEINNRGEVVAEDQISGNYFVRVAFVGPAAGEAIPSWLEGGSDQINDQFDGLSGFPTTNRNPFGVLSFPHTRLTRESRGARRQFVDGGRVCEYLPGVTAIANYHQLRIPRGSISTPWRTEFRCVPWWRTTARSLPT